MFLFCRHPFTAEHPLLRHISPITVDFCSLLTVFVVIWCVSKMLMLRLSLVCFSADRSWREEAAAVFIIIIVVLLKSGFLSAVGESFILGYLLPLIRRAFRLLVYVPELNGDLDTSCSSHRRTPRSVFMFLSTSDGCRSAENERERH